ncbi:MAG TPA: Bax inhibitor-1/YccA family protein [Acidimicrobiales bacterium]|nr:Bax inhibitor-1/YccA family protein [Acidimicrobiales bacterium]
MAQQMISERAFSPEAIAQLDEGRRVTRTMTAGGTVAKGLFLLLVTCGFAVLGWDQAARVIASSSGPMWLLWYFLLIALSFLGIARPRLAPIGGLVYSVLMGLFVGGISRVYDTAYDGIVAQALLATLGVVLVCYILYAAGVVKVTNRFVLVVVAATFGIALVYLLGWILSIIGVNLLFWTHPTPAGIVISVIICIVAALNLFVDYAVIDNGISNGAPSFMEWYAAWGLLATVVWLYLEVLYLLASLRSS